MVVVVAEHLLQRRNHQSRSDTQNFRRFFGIGIQQATSLQRREHTEWENQTSFGTLEGLNLHLDLPPP